MKQSKTIIAQMLRMACLLLLCVIIAPAFVSCGSHDEPSSDPSPQEMIVGKWICYEDAYGDPWDEPFVIQFDSDGTGYLWDQTFPFSEREEFSYIIMESKLRIKFEDEVIIVRYSLSSNGKKLTLYGFDDDDMEELYFTKE